MIEQNKNEFQNCNIIKYHDKGYKGKGVRIAVLDFGELSDYQTYANKPLQEYHNNSTHGSNVCKVIHEVAPESEIFLLTPNAKSYNWIKENNIDLVNCSFTSTKGYAEKLEDDRFLAVCASGNNGGNFADIRYPAAYDWTLSVGAWQEHYDAKANYSNSGESLDVMGYTDIHVPYAWGGTSPFGGTSCATPFVTGMLALAISARQVKRGRVNLKEFARTHCKDLEIIGEDDRTGKGLFVLPEPEIIIEMQIGNNKALINGQEMILEVAPYIDRDKTMVTLREVAEAFGADVQWIAETQEIKITR